MIVAQTDQTINGMKIGGAIPRSYYALLKQTEFATGIVQPVTMLIAVTKNFPITIGLKTGDVIPNQWPAVVLNLMEYAQPSVQLVTT